MSLNIRTPDPKQAVFDIADPDRHGKIIRAGEQQSEVRFDDGAERVVPNAHLCPVEASKVELDNPVLPAAPDTVRQGQEAWERLRSHSTWEDWKKVGAALVIGRAEAMRDGHVNKPKGRSYNAAINAFLKKFGFDGLDSGDRSRLLNVMDHLNAIEGWLGKLPPKERLRLNHPASVLRRWKAATAEPKEQKVSHQQKVRDELIRLQEDNDRMRHEIERGGGDLWTPEDTPKVIAKIMLGKLSKSKAENVAREILKALKGANK
ncbi:MAG: hypothetical protein WBG18_20575 [Xanthobacteraceae bacterium]